MAKALSRPGRDVVVVVAKTCEEKFQQDYTLHGRIEAQRQRPEANEPDWWSKLREQMDLKAAHNPRFNQFEYKKLYDVAEKSILDRAHVIITTCSCTADQRFSGRQFDMAVVDEAGLLSLAEAFLVLERGVNHLFIVGDHHQGNPFVLSHHGIEGMPLLSSSLLEYLVLQQRFTHVMLNIQMRAEHPMSTFISNQVNFTFVVHIEEIILAIKIYIIVLLLSVL